MYNLRISAEIHNMYIHERDDWPNFVWDGMGLSKLLGEVRAWQGGLVASMNRLYTHERSEASELVHVQDVIRTSEIEGVKLDANLVRSSIAKRAGIVFGKKGEKVARNVDGIVDLILDASGNYEFPLDAERLFRWHSGLFPDTGKLRVGAWRDEESGLMQVVSGKYGSEVIHFEAPSFDRVDAEMIRFLSWYEGNQLALDGVIKSAIAHFWFITIHPFEDGNGRIARAIGDMSLARVERTLNRYYSLSGEIHRRRKEYYEILERSQKGGLDISEWIHWYLDCLLHAIGSSDEIIHNVLLKARFWDKHRSITEGLNDRQKKVINKLLEGFEGNLTSSKWARICKCSQDSAYRDISDLVDRGILEKGSAGGRSTNYRLLLDEDSFENSRL